MPIHSICTTNAIDSVPVLILVINSVFEFLMFMLS